MHDDLYFMPTISVMMKALQVIKALTFSVSFSVFCDVTKCLREAAAITSAHCQLHRFSTYISENITYFCKTFDALKEQ